MLRIAVFLVVAASTCVAGQGEDIDFSLGEIPLFFIENRGQLAEEVDYFVPGAGKTLYFTSQGVVFSLVDGERRWNVTLAFDGTDRDLEPRGEARQEAVFSYFRGREEEWKKAVPTFGSIVYEDLWPGIDLRFSGGVHELKYEFIVQPGVDPGLIGLTFSGASDLRVTDGGELEAATPLGPIRDGRPRAFQTRDGKEEAVATRYDLRERRGDGLFSFGYHLGDYDPDLPLVIDPCILVYCGFLGGEGYDVSFRGIAVDDAGCAYLAGYTYSTEATFPVTAGPDLTHNGQYDVFVAKVNAAGSGLVYCGFIGGDSNDCGYGIAVDDGGCAYVTGWTSSEETTFPVVVGPDLTHNGLGSGMDAFVAKVAPDGSSLLYCGYIGGSSADDADGITVDGAGCAYVTGSTNSDQLTFPVAVGPDLTHSGYDDVFVAKVESDGSGLVYCGYLGGNRADFGHGIAVDAAGSVYLSGTTYSSESSFPVVVGPDLTYNGGTASGGDAFVAKVAPDGSFLVYCGYIGGILGDHGCEIALDGGGNSYVAGRTMSDETTFPVAVGPDLTHNGADDAFVAKVAPDGGGLVYCGYIGGGKHDSAFGIAVDGTGCAYLAGEVQSAEWTFPVAVGPDLTDNGDWPLGSAGFVARVLPDASGLDFCGYIGGEEGDDASGVALDGSGNAYVLGTTRSSELTFPVAVGPDLTHNGFSDVFIAKVNRYFPTLSTAPFPLEAGSPGTIEIVDFQPDAETWLAYSFHGPGSVWMPALHVTIDLFMPRVAFGPTLTDGAGRVDWQAVIPPSTAGRSLWLQGVQLGETTSVLEMTIR